MPVRAASVWSCSSHRVPIWDAWPFPAVEYRAHDGEVVVSDARTGWADRLVRWTTTVSVVVLAGIAAIISYKHMFALVHRYGETSWTAALLPVSVDGMIVASSMSLLASSRQGQRSGVLPWVLLVIGSAASLSANVAVAEPSAVGRLIAAWPSAALIGAYELLMRQIRQASARSASEQPATSSAALTVAISDNANSYESSDNPHTVPTVEGAASYDTHTTGRGRSEGAYDAQTIDADRSIQGSHDEVSKCGSERGSPASGRGRRSVSELQRQAWYWAQANRTASGDLPSGKAIAERFGRRERWGRLVKQAGRIEGWT